MGASPPNPYGIAEMAFKNLTVVRNKKIRCVYVQIVCLYLNVCRCRSSACLLTASLASTFNHSPQLCSNILLVYHIVPPIILNFTTISCRNQSIVISGESGAGKPPTLILNILRPVGCTTLHYIKIPLSIIPINSVQCIHTSYWSYLVMFIIITRVILLFFLGLFRKNGNGQDRSPLPLLASHGRPECELNPRGWPRAREEQCRQSQQYHQSQHHQ